MANAVDLPHDEFMPEDVYGARQDKPDQMLFQIESYRMTLGTESRPGSAQSRQGNGIWLFLEGRSLMPGSPVRQAQITFVESGARARPPRLDARTQTLFLTYPYSYLDTILRLLDSTEPRYVQARFHGNSTVWADLHVGPIAGKR